MNQIKIGHFIAQRRKEKNLLQKDIAVKLGISEKTISKWECGNGMPEVVFMEPLCQILGITVNELLAGEPIPILELIDSINISRIELIKQLEFEQMKMRLYKIYDIEIDSMELSNNGAGGLTYVVTSLDKKYVVKYPSDNDMNHLDVEIEVCNELLKKGISACVFITNKQDKKISTDEYGRKFSVQSFYDGVIYEYNAAPKKLQEKSARLLAKIHITIKNLKNLPIGIGNDFFTYRRPEFMKDSYLKTLKIANENNDIEIANFIRSNIKSLESIREFKFDIGRFSCGNSHGDYMISQLIWKNDEINGIIDWTCACKHPYIWEIVRSYVFMAPEVSEGKIDIDCLLQYIKTYLEIGKLNRYDIENAGNLFYYFLTVCNFFDQYYSSISPNRRIYLKQAIMASKLISWFDENIDELNKKLRDFSIQVI